MREGEEEGGSQAQVSLLTGKRAGDTTAASFLAAEERRVLGCGRYSRSSARRVSSSEAAEQTGQQGPKACRRRGPAEEPEPSCRVCSRSFVLLEQTPSEVSPGRNWLSETNPEERLCVCLHACVSCYTACCLLACTYEVPFRPTLLPCKGPTHPLTDSCCVSGLSPDDFDPQRCLAWKSPTELQSCLLCKVDASGWGGGGLRVHCVQMGRVIRWTSCGVSQCGVVV